LTPSPSRAERKLPEFLVNERQDLRQQFVLFHFGAQ